MELRDLLRFSHCGRTVYTLDGSADPAGLRCPVCRQAVQFGLTEAPVRIRAPVGNGHRANCCFLMTSQQGAAGFREENQSELHVGVSTSAGVVFSYTEEGLTCQQQGWEQSIIVPLVAPGNHILSFTTLWDKHLETFAHLGIWTPDRFQEEREVGSCCYGFALGFINHLMRFQEEREFGSCCYGFALGFINHLMRSQGHQPISRDRFTAQFVLPRMETTSRYLSVYQHVCCHGYYSNTV